MDILLIHFSDPGTGVLGPILVHFAALWLELVPFSVRSKVEHPKVIGL